jgi:hypothetical protein
VDAIDHLDLVVSSFERSLEFYADPLRPLGYVAHATPYDRYAIGINHISFAAPDRAAVDERARWLRSIGARTASDRRRPAGGSPRRAEGVRWS